METKTESVEPQPEKSEKPPEDVDMKESIPESN